MWERLQKLIDRIESRVALWQLVRGGGVVTGGLLTGWLSDGIAFVERFGAFGWWLAFLTGALIVALILAAVGHFKARFAEAKLWNRAAERKPADAINPLDTEFHKKRINLAALAHPLTGRIAGKRFFDCELVGPANIFFFHHCTITGLGFGNCDFVLTRSHPVLIQNVIALEHVDIHGGSIFNATVFIHPELLPLIKAAVPGVFFVNLTGDAEIDSRLPPRPV